MANSIILGLDIGSENIKAVVAESSKGKLRLSYAFSRPSAGLRRGAIVDMEETVRAVSGVLNEIKGFYRPAIRNIYVTVGGVGGHYQLSEGSVAISRPGAEISRYDVRHAIEESRAVTLQPNRTVLHSLINEYIVDGAGDIKDPVGMSAARLKVVSLVIDVFSPALKNLRRAIRSAGGDIGGLVYAPLSASRAVLTKNQKENGVVLVDIGAETTGVAVYEEGKLIHINILPVGSKHISSDLAVALQIPVEVADKIKVSHGYAVSHDVSSRDTIDLKKIDPSIAGSPSRRYVSEVIEARLEEIFEMIDKDLALIGRSRKLPSGIVLTGGGAKLPGIVELARTKFKLTAQVGLPPSGLFEVVDHNLLEYVESPEYAALLGLILSGEDAGDIAPVGDGFTEWLKKFIRNIIP